MYAMSHSWKASGNRGSDSVYCRVVCLTTARRHCFSGLLEGAPPGNRELSMGGSCGGQCSLKEQGARSYPGHW